MFRSTNNLKNCAPPRIFHHHCRALDCQYYFTSDAILVTTNIQNINVVSRFRAHKSKTQKSTLETLHTFPSFSTHHFSPQSFFSTWNKIINRISLTFTNFSPLTQLGTHHSWSTPQLAPPSEPTPPFVSSTPTLINQPHQDLHSFHQPNWSANTHEPLWCFFPIPLNRHCQPRREAEWVIIPLRGQLHHPSLGPWSWSIQLYGLR